MQIAFVFEPTEHDMIVEWILAKYTDANKKAMILAVRNLQENVSHLQVQFKGIAELVQQHGEGIIGITEMVQQQGEAFEKKLSVAISKIQV